MIGSFADKDTEALANDHSVRKFVNIERQAQRKLVILNAAKALRDLASPPGNRLEGLKGDRSRQHSIRINDQYLLCFTWKEGNAYDVEITDYH